MRAGLLVFLVANCFSRNIGLPSSEKRWINASRPISYSFFGSFVTNGEAQLLNGQNPHSARTFEEDKTDENLIRHQRISTGNICCASEQWEATAFLSSGDVFIDANTFFAYVNGTGKIVFDAIRKKSYLTFNVTEYTPLMPAPDHSTMTVIKDYEKGIMFQIDEDGNCDKQNTSHDMDFVCIPGGATKLSEGVFGVVENVASYHFTTYGGDVFNVVTVAKTEKPGRCDPVVTTYAVFSGNPDSGTLYSLDVLDLQHTITDPSVFTPPESCNSDSTSRHSGI